MGMSRRQVMATGAAAALARPGPAAAALPEGFYVPAEEAPHERCFMQWPVTRAVYSDRHFRNDVQRTITEIANSWWCVVRGKTDKSGHHKSLLERQHPATWSLPHYGGTCRVLCAVLPTTL